MGFLNWWRNQPQTNDEQLSLLGDESQQLTVHDRVDGATVNKALQSEVQQRGGNRRTHAAVNRVVTENMLDCTPDELHEATGTNQRARMPQAAQEALMTGDISARHEIVGQDAQGHQEIVQAADQGSRRARRLFPW